MRKPLAVLLAGALWAGCATTPAAPSGPPPPRPLSPEAAAFFALAEAPGPAGGVVVDLDALESLGLLGKGDALRQAAGLFGATLPQFVTVSEGPEADLLARGAVAASVLRHWAEWPSAQRFGVVVRPDARQDPSVSPPRWYEAVLALAVEEGSPDNAKLLVGLAALGRSVTEELSREGAEVRLALQDGDLCIDGAELVVPVCLRPRQGLLLLGAPPALDTVEAAMRTAGASAPAAEMAPAPAVPAAPLLVGLRLDVGQMGRLHMALTGRDAVRLVTRVDGLDPRAVAGIDRMVTNFLRDYDAREARKRERIGAALADVRQALAQDAAAPAELKEAARTLTVEQVVDEQGHWARLRQSVQLENTSRGSYAVSLTVPEGMVRAFAEQVGSGGALMVGSVGVLSAIAIPNYVKFQTRAKQTEAKTNLKAAYTAQMLYSMEKGRYGRTFRDIGFTPEPGRRYTYCMGGECLPCDREACVVEPDHAPCKGISNVAGSASKGGGYAVCAYGNLDQDPELDVWVVDDRTREPRQLNSDVD